jgi:tetratricopeptide (TPR) repeat protein
MKRALLGVALAALAATTGCASDPRVVRVYGGKVVEGAFVPPEAYAEYLRGALAEEAGDLAGATAAYEKALGEDDEDPEVWTRVGDVRCKKDPKDGKADDAFAKALKLDRGYAPAHAARARCLAARGKPEEAAAAAREASTHDPSNVDIEALVVRTAPKPLPAVRDRALALTVAHGERSAAWEALAHWGRAHGDAELFTRGLEGLVKLSPSRSAEIEKGALDLLGQGYTAYARRLAASIADVPADRGGSGPRDATLARLAVDDAILGGDQPKVERRAVRAHVALSEVAARAVLLDRRDLATKIAKQVNAADPKSSGAQMVLAAVAALNAKPKEVTPPGPPAKAGVSHDSPPEACVLVLADVIASTSNADTARAWLARVQRTPMAPVDPVVAPLAVDLAARGVIAPDDLALDQRIELAARRRETPPALPTNAALDAKHAFVWHVLTNPTSKEATALHAKLAPAAERDPLVGFAVSRFLLGQDNRDLEAVRRAIAAAPAHPLLLAIAVELAKRIGKTEELTPARAKLMAVARTPAERALATE